MRRSASHPRLDPATLDLPRRSSAMPRRRRATSSGPPSARGGCSIRGRPAAPKGKGAARRRRSRRPRQTAQVLPRCRIPQTTPQRRPCTSSSSSAGGGAWPAALAASARKMSLVTGVWGEREEEVTSVGVELEKEGAVVPAAPRCARSCGSLSATPPRKQHLRNAVGRWQREQAQVRATERRRFAPVRLLHRQGS